MSISKESNNLIVSKISKEILTVEEYRKQFTVLQTKYKSKFDSDSEPEIRTYFSNNSRSRNADNKEIVSIYDLVLLHLGRCGRNKKEKIHNTIRILMGKSPLPRTCLPTKGHFKDVINALKVSEEQANKAKERLEKNPKLRAHKKIMKGVEKMHVEIKKKKMIC